MKLPQSSMRMIHLSIWQIKLIPILVMKRTVMALLMSTKSWLSAYIKSGHGRLGINVKGMCVDWLEVETFLSFRAYFFVLKRLTFQRLLLVFTWNLLILKVFFANDVDTLNNSTSYRKKHYFPETVTLIIRQSELQTASLNYMNFFRSEGQQHFSVVKIRSTATIFSSRSKKTDLFRYYG